MDIEIDSCDECCVQQMCVLIDDGGLIVRWRLFFIFFILVFPSRTMMAGMQRSEVRRFEALRDDVTVRM